MKKLSIVTIGCLLVLVLLAWFMRIYSKSTQITNEIKDLLDKCVGLSIIVIIIITILYIIYIIKKQFLK